MSKNNNMKFKRKGSLCECCINPRLTKGGCCNPPYGFSPVALKR